MMLTHSRRALLIISLRAPYSHHCENKGVLFQRIISTVIWVYIFGTVLTSVTMGSYFQVLRSYPADCQLPSLERISRVDGNAF